MGEKETCLFEISKKKRVTWEITHRCNFYCKHCCNNSLDKNYSSEVSKKRAFEIIDEMAKARVDAIYFTGGEPLLRKDIFAILEHAKNKGINKIRLATNGSLINDKIAKKIAKLNLDSVLISLDGYTSKMHEDFRGVKGSFKLALNAIKLLSKEGVPVRVGCIVWERNYKHLENLLKIALKNGAKSIYFSWLVKSGRSLDNKEILVNNARYFEVARKIFDLKKRYSGKINVGYHRYKSISEDFPSCQGGKKLFHLNAKGNLAPCSWIAKFDNSFVTSKSVNNTSFRDLIKSKCIKDFRNLVQKREKLYGKGCPALCFAENNTFFSKDSLNLRTKKNV